jgi:Tat protein secretion system quality control protein TatD with DNase activity
MLIDSHCHLDFPDFAGELDALIARARALDVARMVTISTRVKRHAEVLAIAERFPDVFCSVGTHPHHAHEELDVSVDDLIGRTHHPKVVAIGEAGLDYHYDLAREARKGLPQPHCRRAPPACRSSVIRVTPTRTWRIWRKDPKGAFPLCCIASPAAAILLCVR